MNASSLQYLLIVVADTDQITAHWRFRRGKVMLPSAIQ